MSEEEIIKYIEDEIENDTDTLHWFDETPNNATSKQIAESISAHQGLLDLYTHKKGRVEELKQELLEEKEKNKNLEEDKKYKDRIIKGLGLNTIPRTINSFNEMIDKYYINKDKIRDLIVERQFELQQEFKDFKDDIRLNTLQEIYYLE